MLWTRRFWAKEMIGAALGAGDADIGEAALFLEAGTALFIEGALMRKQAFLPAGQEHGAEFQALGGMQRHDVDLVVRVAAVAVHHQGDVFEKACHVFELAHGAHEFLEVFEPSFGFGAFVVLPHLGVARFIEHHLGQVRCAEDRASAWRQRLKAFEKRAQRGAGLGRQFIGESQALRRRDRAKGPGARANSCMRLTEVSPMPRLGTLTMRSKARSLSGEAVTLK